MQVRHYLPAYNAWIVFGDASGIDTSTLPDATAVPTNGAASTQITVETQIGGKRIPSSAGNVTLIGALAAAPTTHKPGQVRSLNVTVNGNKSLTSVWAAPADLGAPAASLYLVEVYPTTTQAGLSAQAPAVVSALTHTSAVLLDGNWTVRVSAISSAYVGDEAHSSVSISASLVPPGPPLSVSMSQAPLGSVIEVQANQSVGSGLTNYEWELVGASLFTGSTSTPAANITTGVTQVGTYMPRVRSIGPGGASAWVSGASSPFASRNVAAMASGSIASDAPLTITPTTHLGSISPFTVKYQLVGSDSIGGTGNRVEYPDTASTTITIPTAEAGRYIQINERYYNAAGVFTGSGYGVAINSGAYVVGPVAGSSRPVNTSLPTITGGTTSGSSITLSAGSWSNNPTQYDFQLKRNGVNLGAKVTQSGASTTYTLTVADEGTTLTLDVQARNASGDAINYATSAGYSVPAGTTSGGVGPASFTHGLTTSEQSALVASGSIVATSGQVITGKLFNSGSSSRILIPSGVTGVKIYGNQLVGSGGLTIEDYGTNTEVYNNLFTGTHSCGIRHRFGAGFKAYRNKFTGTYNDGASGSGLASCIQVNYCDNWQVRENLVDGATGFTADIISLYSCSYGRVVGNIIRNSAIQWMHAAGMTIGDYSADDPNAQARNAGGNNYFAGNYFATSLTGGVAPGVFGSTSNTVLEYNCFGVDIQAYNYSGTYVGVIVRNNAIRNMDGSNLGEPRVEPEGWNTNVLGTTPASVPGAGLGYYAENGTTWVPTYVPA